MQDGNERLMWVRLITCEICRREEACSGKRRMTRKRKVANLGRADRLNILQVEVDAQEWNSGPLQFQVIQLFEVQHLREGRFQAG
jgi:hypothetical protein